MKKLRNFFRGTYLGLMLIFLYAPILVLMVFSFNGSKSMARWTGFSFKWYEALMHDSHYERPHRYSLCRYEHPRIAALYAQRRKEHHEADTCDQVRVDHWKA